MERFGGFKLFPKFLIKSYDWQILIFFLFKIKNKKETFWVLKYPKKQFIKTKFDTYVVTELTKTS